MGELKLGLSLGYLRHLDKTVEWGIRTAADIGYEYVEPTFRTGHGRVRTASSTDPLALRDMCDKYGVRLSGLLVEMPFSKPELALAHLARAARFATEAGAPMIVVADQSLPPNENGEQISSKAVLQEVAAIAERCNIRIAIRTHGAYASTPELLRRLMLLCPSRAIGVDFDTGDSYLVGNDPAHWLREIVDDVISIRAQDVSEATISSFNRSRRIYPCACGRGLLDWDRIVTVAHTAPRHLVLSVEISCLADAYSSFTHLSNILTKTSVPA